VGEDFYRFQPYDYGPFSSDIYSDARMLESDGFISIENPLSRGWRRYSITNEGISRAKEISEKIPNEVLIGIRELSVSISSMGFAELIRHIYKEYPEYKRNSVFH
jgi:hypothetical protein